MSKVEVLVATMHQTNLSLFEKMNIQTDVIFCNQCDKNDFIETEINGCRVRMLSTTTRGVGINRNLVMQLSDADLCLCADDDEVLEEGYEDIITKAFSELPRADLIAFNIKITNADNKISNTVKSSKRQKIKNYGTVCLAYKNSSAKKFNISFSRLFGGGAVYSCGEDTLFCRDFKKYGRLYSYNITIATISTSNSTWFKGYSDKFFFDKGALMKAAYSYSWRIKKYYLVIIYAKKNTGKSVFDIISLMNRGAKSYKNGYIFQGDEKE